MRTIGLVGGMSWESTIPYYRHINEFVKERRGGLHSARVILYSVDFAEIERMQREAEWAAAGELLAHAARNVEAAGAEILVLCTNTMHKVAPAIAAAVQIPFLHIADATAEAIKKTGCATVGLLGTRFVMEQEFYRDRLTNNHGLDMLIPPARDRDIVHRVIFDELCLGKIENSSREEYRRIMGELIARGAQGIILGCTEIALLVDAQDASVPLFDTTRIHARRAAAWALEKG